MSTFEIESAKKVSKISKVSKVSEVSEVSGGAEVVGVAKSTEVFII